MFSGLRVFGAFAALFVISLILCAPVKDAQAQQTIRDIEIVGAERIDPATILTYLDVRVGDPMDQDTFNKALKSLFATGLFADVTLRQRAGNTLEVTVLENPVISQIVFEGNDKLKNEDLMAEIQLRPRHVLTRTRVQSDVNRLYQLYQRNGRFSASIEPKIIQLDQNRVNLVFEVTEGPVTKVRSVRFVGNRHYTDAKLRSEISTKEARWYRFLTSDDRYDPDRLGFDQELLRRFYLAQGYADFRVVSAVAELSRDRDHFFLTFTLEEGERYRVGEVSINASLRHFDATVLKPYITFSKGQWYNADEVTRSIDRMTDALGDRQYAFVSVRPEIRRDREARTVDIIFTINETPRVFVERIDIRGNVRTLDKVVRREFELVEGDPFNRSKLEKSEQNIRNLDFFETVDIRPVQGSSPDRTVVEVDVTEKSTGELSLGAGFSTADGPLADIRIRERNLLGKGQDMLIAGMFAGRRQEFNFSFTEPYFMNRDFSAGFDAFHITRDLQRESSFDQRQSGGALRIGYPLSDRWRQQLRYRVERNEIRNVRDDASRFIKDQEGRRVTSAVSQRLTYDSRDSIIFPTSGLYGWLDTEIAGLGGDARYVSGRLGSSYFYPIASQWVFNVLGETGAMTGIAGKNVQINERFFLGGTNLRGFRSAGVGPRDLETRDALGGNLFYRGTVEMSFPIGFPDELGVLGHGFTDFGSLWHTDGLSGGDTVDNHRIRAAAGVGISWRSPLGPIRLDYSRPYIKEKYDRTEHFQFNFGTRF